MDDRSSGGLRVAMALYGDLTHDSRVLREADALSRSGHEVTIYCLTGAAPGSSPFRVVCHLPSGSSVLPGSRTRSPGRASQHAIAKIIGNGRWMAGYMSALREWGRWAVAAADGVDVWHAHDLTGLMAVGPHLSKSEFLVYDSHEIFMDSSAARGLPRPLRMILAGYERRLARRASALVTVNEGYAGVLNEQLRPARTVIVRNCPPRWTPPSPPSTRLRDAVGVSAETPLVLYQGIFTKARGLEQLTEALLEPGLESTHVALLGFGASSVVEPLTNDPRFGGRVHVLEAVPPDELLEWVSGADAAVSLLQPAGRDHALSTPNKLWESLAAGVPVIASDYLVMRRILRDDPDGTLGEVCDPTDPASIGGAVRSLIGQTPAERAAQRARCLRAAQERWNWETEALALQGLYASLKPAA